MKLPDKREVGSSTLPTPMLSDYCPQASKRWRFFFHASVLLVPPKWVLPKERPHLTRRVDVVAHAADHPFRERFAARPLVACAPDGVEHHGRIGTTVGVFEASDIRHHRLDGVRSAPVSSGPIRRPGQDARKRSGGCQRLAAVVRN